MYEIEWQCFYFLYLKFQVFTWKYSAWNRNKIGEIFTNQLNEIQYNRKFITLCVLDNTVPVVLFYKLNAMKLSPVDF